MSMILLILINFLPGYQPTSGTKIQWYQMDYQVRMDFDLQPALGNDFNTRSMSVDLHLQGELLRYQVESNDSAEYYQFRFEPKRTALISNGQLLTGELLTEFQREITLPFLVQYEGNGAITGVRIHKTLSGTAEMAQKAIAGYFQFVSSPDSGVAWQATEPDPVGLARIEYTSLPTAGHYTKAKISYASIQGAYGTFNSPEVKFEAYQTVSKGKLPFDFEELEAREERTMLLNEERAGKMTSNFHAKAVSGSMLPEKASPMHYSPIIDSVYWEFSPLYEVVSRQKMKMDRYKKLLGNVTALDLVALSRNTATWQDTIYDRLVAMLEIQPSAAPEFGKNLLNLAPDTPGFQMISNALAEVHSLPCQEQLKKLLETRGGEWLVMYEVLPLLALMPDPDSSLVKIVHRFTFDQDEEQISRTSQLTLGAMAMHLREKGPALSTALTKDLITSLKGRTDDRQFLLVLGNTGHRLALPEIMVFLAGKDLTVIPTALESLRFIRERSIDQLLEEYSAHEEKAIRDAAHETLQFRRQLIIN